MPCHARPFQADKRASGSATRTRTRAATPSAGRQGSPCVAMNSEREESFRFTAPTDRPTTSGLSITGACVRVAAAPGCLLSGCALHGDAGKRETLPRWAGVGGSACACESAHQQRLADNKNRQPMKQAASMAESAALFFGGGGALAAFTAAASPQVPQLAQRLARSNCGLNCVNLLVTGYHNTFSHGLLPECKDAQQAPHPASS